MPKIKGKKTTGTYIHEQVEDWKENCGMANKHFINTNSMTSMVTRCIAHAKRMTVVWRDAQKQNSKRTILEIMAKHESVDHILEHKYSIIADEILKELKGKI